MADLETALRYVRRTLRRGSKWVAQRRAPVPAAARALFVVGCQRSGTTMLMDVLDRAPFTWVYQEHDRAAFEGWKLRPRSVREPLLAASNAAWVVFKPLYDAQRLDELLADHPDARAIWVNRSWRDVAASSARKWGALLPPVVRRLVEEDDCDHWMADRLPRERRAQLATFDRPELGVDTAAALRWWLRNEVYFDLALHERRDRVLTVRYEDLVRRPEQGFGELFDFLGQSLDPAWLADLSTASVGRGASLDVDPAVAALCDALTERIEAARAEARP